MPYGIRGNAFNLFKSCLSNRKQYTHVLNENSEMLNVLYGVPQGLVLGQLFFLIYIKPFIFSTVCVFPIDENCARFTVCTLVPTFGNINLSNDLESIQKTT